MRIIRDVQLATYTLVPMEVSEQELIHEIAASLKPGDKMAYNGRTREDDKFSIVHLNAGGREEQQSKTDGGLTVCQTVYSGGVKLTLRGSTEEDKYEVNGIRNTCYFGSGGLVFLGTVPVDGKVALVTTADYCKLCGAAMIDSGRCEWKVCSACADKCDHRYERGAIHGSGVDIGVGEFCQVCGLGKPDPVKLSLLEHHLAAERELGVTVVYRDTPLSPAQLDYLQKIARAPFN